MRRAALLTALTLLVAACGGTEDSATSSTDIPDGPDGDVTTTQARTEPTIEGAAASGQLVSVDYTGTLTDGSEFDSSIGREPLQFTIDSGQMIQGFNDAVVGMQVGETKTVTLPPEEAYQDYSADLLVEVPVDQLPEGVVVGDELLSPLGQRVTVVEIADGIATIDENHPLAGETLIFEITLVSIDG
jgi:peptidylprolyl isomerase